MAASAGVLIGFTNRILTGSLSAGSEAVGQSVGNLQSGQCSPATAWQTAAGVTSSYFLIDAGSAASWRAFCLARTNLTNSAMVRWRVGSLDDVSTSSLAYTFASMASANLISFSPIDVTQFGPQPDATGITGSAYFVSPTGSDTNPGTQSAPFATLTKARDMMRSTSTKKSYFDSGNYPISAQLVLSPSDSGTTYTRMPGKVPIVDGLSSIQDVIFIDSGTHDITVNGFTFKHVVRSAIHMNGYSTGGVYNCTLTNNTIQYVGGSTGGYAGSTGGIFGTWNCYSNTISHNRITDCVGPAIAIVADNTDATQGQQGNVVTWNDVARTNNSGLTDTGALYFLDRRHTGTSSNKTQVKWNRIVDAGGSANVRGVYFDDQMSYVDMIGNLITGSMSFAVNIHGGDHVTITGNIFDVTQTRNFFGIYQDVPTGQTNYGMASNSCTGNIIFSQGPTYPASQMWAYYFNTGVTIAKPTMTNNLFWMVGGTLPSTAGDIPDTSPKVADPFFNPAGATAIAFDSGTIPAGVAAGILQSVTVAPASAIGQYCRCDISDPYNPDGFLNVPGAYAGEAWQPAVGLSSSTAQGRDDQTAEFTTRGGQEFPRLYYTRRRAELDFQSILASELWTQADALDQVARTGVNILVVPEPLSTNRHLSSVFGRFKSKSDFGYFSMVGDRRTWRASVTERL